MFFLTCLIFFIAAQKTHAHCVLLRNPATATLHISVTGKGITEILLASFFRARICYAFAKAPKTALSGSR